MGCTDTVSVDGPKVTPDEATEHCLHHLLLAAKFYQAVPDDANASIDAELRRFSKRYPLGMNAPAFMAAKSWLATIVRAYEVLKPRDPA